MYQIVLSNGTTLASIADSTLDNVSTSLTLVGQNTLGYGSIFNNNFVRLLENGANNLQPVRPLVGQLWYDTSVGALKICSQNTPTVTWLPLYFGLAAVTAVAGATGNISLSTLVSNGLAPLASPIFTGTPVAPTATTGTTTTQIATTAFVNNTLSALSTGVVSIVGATGVIALTDLEAGGVAPQLSPTLTGTPAAPTATLGTNTTQIATTAFVAAATAPAVLTTAGMAPLASPTLTGTPAAPTATTGTTTTQIATTAFVANTLAANPATTPNMLLNPKLIVQQMHTPGTVTTITNQTDIYLNDGWNIACSGVPTMTAQTVALGDTDRAAIGDESAQYAFRVSTSGTPGTSDYALLGQCLDNNYLYSGKQVSVGFWAYASGMTSPKLCVEFGQVFGSGGTPNASVYGIGMVPGTVTLTSSWAYYTITGVVIPSVAGKTFGTTANTDFLTMRFWLTAGTTIGAAKANNIGSQAYTLNLWNPQLQFAPSVTVAPSRSYQEELSRCMRYYEISGFSFGGYNLLGASSYYGMPFKVQKRIAPTPTISGGSNANCTAVLNTSVHELQIVTTNTATGPFSAAGTWIADARF